MVLNVTLTDLHGGQDQQNGEVDLNDHVNVVFSKKSGSKADRDQEHGWDKDGQQVVDDWSAQSHLDDKMAFILLIAELHISILLRV